MALCIDAVQTGRFLWEEVSGYDGGWRSFIYPGLGAEVFIVRLPCGQLAPLQIGYPRLWFALLLSASVLDSARPLTFLSVSFGSCCPADLTHRLNLLLTTPA